MADWISNEWFLLQEVDFLHITGRSSHLWRNIYWFDGRDKKKNFYDRQMDVWEDNQSKLIERRFHLFTLIRLFNNLTYAISFNFPKNDN